MYSLSCAKDYYHFEIRKVVAVVFFFFSFFLFLYKSHKNSSKTMYPETEKELTWAVSLGSGDWRGFQGGK